MNDDASYILDLLAMQRDSLKRALLDKRIRREKFDRFSYSAWAIQETLDAVEQYGSYHYITVSVIVNILQNQERDYCRYYEYNNDKQQRYGYALDTISQVLKITGGYLYD